MKNKNILTVVIPAYNEEKYIRDCLQSLVGQRTSKPFEVILVDNKSTDATVQNARRFTQSLNLKIVSETKRGRGAARARGFSEVQGEIIFSVDADTQVPANWLETLSVKFNNPRIGAVTGPCDFRDLPTLPKIIVNRLQRISMFLYRSVHGYFWLSGFNFAIRKDLYVKSGGFDQNLQAFEDIELSRRVSRIAHIHYTPLTVIASGRRFHQGLLRGALDYIRAYFKYFLNKEDNVILHNIR